MNGSFAPPRATWSVMRIIAMQISLSLAIILENAIFQRDNLLKTFSLTYTGVMQHGFVWQLLTTALIEVDAVNLLFHCLLLWMFGSELEQRWGRSTFLRFYAACALGSSLAFLAIAAVFPVFRNQIFATSTGANLGILMAYAVYWPDRQVWVMFLFPVRIKFLVLVIGLFEVLYAVTHTISPILAGGHLGGLITAVLLLILSGGEPTKLNRIFAELREQFAKTKNTPAAPSAETKENLDNRIDAILDKISRDGMKSLTAEEKKFLREASERMNRTRK
ncbi:MAG: rhomboid family intramembrane serine protease [Spirochaetes bacterium]|nr:rhomboid family intramembrane serine protease [Spirochaetota bacterium]